MRQEVPFRSMKITLSEEAIERLGELRLRGLFRSDSATVEECIRIVYDTANDIALEIGRAKRSKLKEVPLDLQAETLRGIAIRIMRFLPREELMKILRKEEP